jgi:type IV pilus assembly protein PilC
MKFNYQARSEDGQIQSGVVEARDLDDAVAVLQKHGLYVSFIDEEKVSVYEKEISFFEKIAKKDIVLFSRQMAIMFKAGVPIVESLKSIGEQTNKQKFKEQIIKIAEKVEGGQTLSQALIYFPRTFSPFYVGMIKSGEVSGRLSETLEYLAGHLEREYNFNNKIIGALTYPVFVLLVFISILFFMMIFVIPKLADIFAEMELPFLTRVILGASAVIAQWWWLPIIFLILPVILAFRYLKTEEGKKTLDKIVFKIPLINEFFKKISLVRVAENLSTLIAGGLPIVQAIEVTSDVVGSEKYREIMIETKNGVRRGELMSHVLLKYPKYFPPLFVQMIMVGEKTGKIDSSLRNVVSFYQGDIDRALEGLIKLLEPIMIIILGGMVGLLVISILMPIYQISV